MPILYRTLVLITGSLVSHKTKSLPQFPTRLVHRQLQIWTEHSTLLFENLKPVEKSKNHFSIIWTSSKVGLIFKIRRMRLKIKPATPILVLVYNFENQCNFCRCSNDAKMIFWFLYWFQIFKDQCALFRPYLCICP